MGARKSKHKNKQKISVFKRIQCLFDRSRLGELLVLKGIITPQDLRLALQKQKETNQQLGQVFLNQKLISRSQLAMVLGSQSLMRIATGVMLCGFLIFGFNKKARADTIKDIPGQISLVTQFNNTTYHKIGTYPALFGSDEKRSHNLAPFTKWTGMFKRFERELGKSNNQSIISDWKIQLERIKHLDLKSKADRVNDLVNEKRYILDNRNWGKSDYWATPVEFLKRGGDCEDFAIAKYTALRMIGVPEERLRIAIVHDTQKNIPHAILIVYTDQGPYFLDNQIKSMVSADTLKRYRPIFSINQHAWWLHTAPTSTKVAYR